MANRKRKRSGNQKRKSIGNEKRRMIMIMIMNINGKFPEDIVKVIFSKLAFSDLPNCRIVCKAWNRVVLDYTASSSKFHIPNAFLVYSSDITMQPPIDGHLQPLNPKMSCIDFDTATSVAALTFDRHCPSVQIDASCNGLLYIHKLMSVRLWSKGIWNPMTNEFFKIPGSEREEDVYRIGFGFNPKTKQYKLFRITYEDDDAEDEFISTVEVWRFGISHQWEHLECQPFRIPHHGVYLGGLIYWFGYDTPNDSVIYALDVETETFETIAILDLGPYSAAKFQPFNDTICLIVFYPLKVDVWIMRAKHSWIKKFVIDLPRAGLHRFYHIKAFEDEGDIYFLVGNDLFCFGKNGKKTKLKTLFNPSEKVIEGVVHLEAFHFGSLQKILAGSH